MDNLSPQILFEDSHLLVINKPSGLLSQSDHTQVGSLVDWARKHVGRHYVGLIHRLDRNTSGCILLAKRSKAAQRLTDQLQKGQLERTYLAWVVGNLDQKRIWKHLLEKDEQKNKVFVTTKNGKLASLQVTPLRKSEIKGTVCTLSRFELETGRSHQIRVQSAHEGFPLLGDVKYNPKGPPFSRLALHSFEIRFFHPISKEHMEFEAPLPEILNF